MYRLPTQFDPRGSHADESASAGGSTSTTCSSCVVTLGSSAVITSIYFSSLAKQAADTAAAAPAEPPLAAPGETPVPAPAPPPSRAGWAVLGFFTPVLALLAGGGVAAALGNLVLAPFLAVATWLLLFYVAHEKNGRTPKQGLVVGGVSLVVLVAALAGEMFAWLS